MKPYFDCFRDINFEEIPKTFIGGNIFKPDYSFPGGNHTVHRFIQYNNAFEKSN